MTTTWKCVNCLTRVTTASMYDPCPECERRNKVEIPGTGADKRVGLSVSELLAERGQKYGDVDVQAATFDAIMQAMTPKTGSNWKALAPRQRQSLAVIAIKISRIMHGDPDYDDNWDDIAGYAILGKNRK